MIHTVTNRNALKGKDWLLQVASQEWKVVEPGAHETLKIQQFDFAANLNGGLIIQKIKDAFQAVTDSANDPATEAQRVGSDGPMAVAIHKALDGLTAREGSDPNFWAYLCVIGCPKYVRWRWSTSKPDALWTRFAGNTRRNALSRLWWWAEITHDSTKSLANIERYKITKNVHGRQSLMLWLVDCAFSGHPLLVQQLSAIQEAKSLNDSEQKKICRCVNRLARIVCLDSLSVEAEAKELCNRALEVSELLPA